jgi:hypothetical protein
MMRKIFIACLMLVAPDVVAFPIQLIGANAVANGFIITNSGYYLLSDDAYAVAAVNQAISINVTNVTLDLNGKTILGNLGTTGVAGIRVDFGCTGNVTIRNGTIQGFGGPSILIESTVTKTGIILDNVTVRQGLGAGVSGTGSITELTIRNCSITTTGILTGTGVLLSNVFDAKIDNCTVQGCSLEGLALSGNNILVKNSRVSRNNWLSTLNSGGLGGIVIVTGTAVMIDTVQADENKGLAGINLQTVVQSIVRNCNAQANTGTAYALQATSSLVMVQNCLAVGNAIGFANATPNVTFIGNLAYGNTTTNYLAAGAGTLGTVGVFNGAQLPAGTLLDRTIDNISII